MTTKEIVVQNSILQCQTGSHLYGVQTPLSDQDFFGVYVPPNSHILGLGHELGSLFGLPPQKEMNLSIIKKDEEGRNLPEAMDVIYHDIKKFATMALAASPNALEVLWSPFWVESRTNDFGRSLIEIRDSFLSKTVHERFLGYAKSQRHKMVNITKGEQYNKKYASHLIRLLFECKSLLEDCHLVFPLPEYQRGLVLQVKSGERTMKEVIDLSEDLEEECLQLTKKTSLPEDPDYKKVHEVVMNIVGTYVAKESFP